MLRRRGARPLSPSPPPRPPPHPRGRRITPHNTVLNYSPPPTPARRPPPPRLSIYGTVGIDVHAVIYRAKLLAAEKGEELPGPFRDRYHPFREHGDQQRPEGPPQLPLPA